MKIQSQNNLKVNTDKKRKVAPIPFHCKYKEKKTKKNKQKKEQPESCSSIFALQLTQINAGNKALQKYPTSLATKSILPTSNPSKGFSQLSSPLKLTSLNDGFFTKLQLDTPLGSLDINIEQVQQHTMHYQLHVPPYNIELLQAFLPSLLKKLQTALPKQSHHMKRALIKDDRVEKDKKQKN